jgi:hypothetical protein
MPETPSSRESTDDQLMQGAIALGELAPDGGGSAFALFFGADTHVEGDRHAVTPCCFCIWQNARTGIEEN